ncbi:hypothetical protein ACU8MT_24725 (plasmid) [Rhizobium leguminosarum]
MKTVAMILRGTVASCTEKTYMDKVRPSAKYADGLTFCEVRLANENSTITNAPQSADLYFMHVIKFESGINEIELYDGPKLAMKFWPMPPPS